MVGTPNGNGQISSQQTQQGTTVNANEKFEEAEIEQEGGDGTTLVHKPPPGNKPGGQGDDPPSTGLYYTLQRILNKVREGGKFCWGKVKKFLEVAYQTARRKSKAGWTTFIAAASALIPSTGWKNILQHILNAVMGCGKFCVGKVTKFLEDAYQTVRPKSKAEWATFIVTAFVALFLFMTGAHVTIPSVDISSILTTVSKALSPSIAFISTGISRVSGFLPASITKAVASAISASYSAYSTTSTAISSAISSAISFVVPSVISSGIRAAIAALSTTIAAIPDTIAACISSALGTSVTIPACPLAILVGGMVYCGLKMKAALEKKLRDRDAIIALEKEHREELRAREEENNQTREERMRILEETVASLLARNHN
eukprot:m.43323 g.43323  ORF g.43323 m.43323 type:complete len:373 (+) comp7106_c0_seq3:166-1284(+)